MQLRFLSPQVAITLVDWQYPLGRSTEALVRFGPKALGAAIWDRKFRGRFGMAPPEVDIEHYWHVGAAAARRSLSVPYVVTCHGSEILRAAVRPAYRKQFRRVLLGAGAVTANSVFTKRLVESQFQLAPDAVRLMVPGVDLSKFSGLSPQRSPDGTVRVGTLCRLEPRKNVLAVIEALKWLQPRVSSTIEYRLAGDGPERQRIIRALERSGLRWRYYGSIDENTKVTDFYANLDVFVLVPLALRRDVEGFGIVYLEANACGVPVVAARTGGVESAVQGDVSGVFADPRNPAEIGQCVADVVEAGESLRRSALAWARTLSATRAAQAFLNVYEELLRTRPTECS